MVWWYNNEEEEKTHFQKEISMSLMYTKVTAAAVVKQVFIVFVKCKSEPNFFTTNIISSNSKTTICFYLLLPSTVCAKVGNNRE